MSTVTFDTLKFVETLKKAALIMTRLLQLHMQDAATDQELVTKTDLQLEMAPIKAELQVLKWMSGLIMGGIIALTRGSRARQFHFQ